MMTKDLLGESWFAKLETELQEPYIKELKSKLLTAYAEGIVRPRPTEVFDAFRLTPFEKVKVVILSQDPYPSEHAHGLAFSSQKRVVPASLGIIFRELDRTIFKTEKREEYQSNVTSNNLSGWAEQGVLLLNSVLTVNEGQSGSHNGFGWQKLTGKALELLWRDYRPKVFVLWGVSASETFSVILDNDQEDLGRNHLVLNSGHPATAIHGKDLFSGNNHFLKINKFLQKTGQDPIDWRVL